MGSPGKGRDSLSHLLEQVPSSVADADLDDYIANLILQQSRQRGAQYGRQGIGAYLDDQPGPSNRSKAVSTNKAFLASVIRNVEGHNSALLRQQIADTPRTNRDRRNRKTSPLSPTQHHKPKLKAAAEDKDRNPSKMDKYFRKDYDPALDVELNDLTDPSTGLIAANGETSSAAFDRLMTVLDPQSGSQSKRDSKRLRKEERDRIRALREARRESRARDRSRSPSPHRHRRHGKEEQSSSLGTERRRPKLHSRSRKDDDSFNPHPPKAKVREWDVGKNLSF